jgi:hypothetical protein
VQPVGWRPMAYETVSTVHLFNVTLALTCITHDLCHMSVGVTSNTYCNHKYGILTVTPTLTYIVLPTGVLEFFAHATVRSSDILCMPSCLLTMLLSCAQSPRVSCAAMALTAFYTLQVYHKLRKLFTIWRVLECSVNQNVITVTNGEHTILAYKHMTPVLTNTSSSISNTSDLYPEDRKVKLPLPR